MAMSLDPDNPYLGMGFGIEAVRWQQGYEAGWLAASRVAIKEVQRIVNSSSSPQQTGSSDPSQDSSAASPSQSDAP